MTPEESAGCALSGLGCLWVIVGLAFWITVGFVAYHFIAKAW